ncbi:NADH dehydrogenase [ubiquinone] 1 beta subcomplex subunit 11, mitochondrial-like [Cherax quadricarinatus]|uniref:NADH dehydrogenase [ubiquinone] 1 beta subcomplex subunit 11, mitochondrial-like n=1 Tax=Cherax quadricarinatus TaxID=27406 RepID=UPI00237816BF|nr:NADH dehydrogenase [ubiquinone] 1 beta subcomplex subunit 11, mitochondrial-like [Cherax quadricarinatus]
MAALSRLSKTAFRLNNDVLKAVNGALVPSNGVFVPRVVGISTSKKNKDTVTVTDAVVEHVKDWSKTEQTAVTKNWISYDSEVEDNTIMHLTFFFGVTLCIVTIGFVWAYLPDFRMVDWAQREGYLELRRREAEVLPLIDPNLISIEKIELPLDEKLADTEIII